MLHRVSEPMRGQDDRDEWSSPLPNPKSLDDVPPPLGNVGPLHEDRAFLRAAGASRAPRVRFLLVIV